MRATGLPLPLLPPLSCCDGNAQLLRCRPVEADALASGLWPAPQTAGHRGAWRAPSALPGAIGTGGERRKLLARQHRLAALGRRRPPARQIMIVAEQARQLLGLAGPRGSARRASPATGAACGANAVARSCATRERPRRRALVGLVESAAGALAIGALQPGGHMLEGRGLVLDAAEEEARLLQASRGPDDAALSFGASRRRRRRSPSAW